MAVDDSNKINSVLPTALQSRVKTSVPFASSLLNIVKNPFAVAVAAIKNLTPTQQAALLGSEALQTLNLEPTVPAEPLLANSTTPDSTTILESQGLSPAQEAALAVNETVQTALETQNLTPAQQAALAANQATQTMVAPPAAAETTIPAAAGVAGQTPAPGAVTTSLASGAALVVEAPGVNIVPPAATPTQLEVSATETAVAPAVLNPTQVATAQPISYKNAFAVYEVKDPNPAPTNPASIRQEVHSLLSIGRVRPIDPLVLKQAWEIRKKTRSKEVAFQEDNTDFRPPLAEKAIQQKIVQANEDLAKSGVPLHLVLAQNDGAFVLDIYDSSDGAVCQVVQEVPVDLDNLLTLLDNLEHEAGIIVNVRT
ncbi:MAG: hypothetical protein NT087_12245 [Deltaproteobacteria bacterium]|nr:hypothetical protein [Deltaproteobacteria bacterium]